MNKEKLNKRSGRRGDPISLAPLTPDTAMAALLRVKPADLKKREEEEAAEKKLTGKKKGK